MPIKSYLAHPKKGKREELVHSLSKLEECEVILAENNDLIILVTETSNKSQEDKLKEKLETIESLKLLSMVSGFNTTKNE